MVDLFERLDAMFDQESSSYKTIDYLKPEYQLKLASICDPSHIDGIPTTTASSWTSSSSGINDIWREKICEWSYQVIDHFDFSREIVSISIHYLDRFLATRPCNKKVFQLAAMTTLFLAIKLYEPGRLSMHSMIELSRGYFKVEQMLAMELAILRSLSWQVHPPTAYCFGKHLLFLLPCNTLSTDDRHAVLELARFLTELSVIDYFFVSHKPSVVALASLLNAIDDIPNARAAKAEFLAILTTSSHLDPTSQDVLDCYNRLRLLYIQGGYANHSSDQPNSRSDNNSPVCVVTYGCQQSHFAHTTSESTTNTCTPSISR